MAALAAPADDVVISTPDRRVRVFISSTLVEMAAERRAVRDAVRALHQTPIMFETGARHHPPRQLYRAYLQQSDVFVGIYGAHYGWVAPGEQVSGLEDEYLLSRGMPTLLYVQQGTDRDVRLDELVRRIEADDTAAYKPFATPEDLAELVADDLAVLLTERFTARATTAPTGLRPPRVPVPTTPILGRATEIDLTVSLLRDPDVRLVTVLGAGGMGKTRLALAVAARMTGDPRDDREGVWFVDLTVTHDPTQVLAVVAAALGVHQEGPGSVLDLLVDRLTGRRLLLVLDNLEHVTGAVPELAALLAALPGLTILATSRSALQLRGEREVPLGPLDTPPPDEAVTPAAVSSSPAVDLFVARARQTRPTFVLDVTNAAAVAELARRLEGVPLALELAAAQLRLLTPQALLDVLRRRLDRSLDLGSGPVDLPSRQQTLRATLEWSHSLLRPAEQTLLARLSVFVGTFTLEGAEAVGGDDGTEQGGGPGVPDVLDTLSSLVAQSLVSVSPRDTGEPRFAMLDLVRAFAREQLEAAGGREAATARLTRHLAAFATEAGEHLLRGDTGTWNDRVEASVGDLLTTMTHAIAADRADEVIALSAPLFSYWWSHGQLDLMRDLAEQAAALPSAAHLSPAAAAELLWGRGMFRIVVGDSTGAEPHLEQLLEQSAALGDVRLHAFALAGLGIAVASHDVARARPLLDGAVTSFRGRDDRWGLTFALSSAGLLAVAAGDVATAQTMHREGLATATALGNEHLQAQLHDQLAFDLIAAGEVDGARAELAAAVTLHTRLVDQEGSSYCLAALATIALSRGRADRAAVLLGAAGRARRIAGVAIWPVLQPFADAMAAAVAAALPPDRLAACTARGEAMRSVEALAWGLAATEPDPPATDVATPANGVPTPANDVPTPAAATVGTSP